MRAISRYEFRIKPNPNFYSALVEPFPLMSRSKFDELMEGWNAPMGQPRDFIEDDLYHFFEVSWWREQ